jgi:hypothetical protein
LRAACHIRRHASARNVVEKPARIVAFQITRPADAAGRAGAFAESRAIARSSAAGVANEIALRQGGTKKRPGGKVLDGALVRSWVAVYA